ncbi:MAG: ABC transporter C-terminal domain-containing protein [Anaerolineae bacterium]|nr:ABC transporter C-terminal domain-containing protein [Anaerolineae bacterium]
MVVFEGPYREYVQARAGGQSPPTPSPPEKPPETGRKANGQEQRDRPRLSPYARTRRVKEVEARIDWLEVRLVELSGELGAASEEGDVARVRTLGEEYATVEAELESHLEEWEALME